MSNAHSAADAIEAIVHRGTPEQAHAALAGLLERTLDRYELSRLYRSALSELHPPDATARPHRLGNDAANPWWCPWCSHVFGEPDFSGHLAAAHPEMLGAGNG